MLFLGRRRIAVNNGVDFGATPASAQISMRSKPVTQSNGVVVQKSSVRKLPNSSMGTAVEFVILMDSIYVS